MNFVFFTFRDFKNEGGGTIRMYGVLNALVKTGAEVTLISNAENYSKFDPKIRHVFLGASLPKKAVFQALVALLPSRLVAAVFQKRLQPIIHTINENINEQTKLFFFEYLDNSLGFLLKGTGNIDHYYNDIHGVAPVEFDYQRKNAKNWRTKLLFRLKYDLADLLDRKVMENAKGIIYSSQGMEHYFAQKYRLANVQTYILPNLLADEVAGLEVDKDLAATIKQQYAIKEEETVLLFSGGYKPTAGVEDLVRVCEKLLVLRSDLRLILIGGGPAKKEVEDYVERHQLQDRIIFIERVDYHELPTYQSLADIIVCPDRMNAFSNMILHLKYLDALMANRIVLNGAFDSVLEINPNEELSLNFTPSDMVDLYDKLLFAIENKEILLSKYRWNRSYALRNLTYASAIKTLKY